MLLPRFLFRIRFRNDTGETRSRASQGSSTQGWRIPSSELEDFAVEFGVCHELLETLVVQSVEQLLGILRIEPEDLAGPGLLVSASHGLGLPSAWVLYLDKHPVFGAYGWSRPMPLVGIHTDIDQCAGDGHVCPGCSVALGDGCVPALPLR